MHRKQKICVRVTGMRKADSSSHEYTLDVKRATELYSKFILTVEFPFAQEDLFSAHLWFANSARLNLCGMRHHMLSSVITLTRYGIGKRVRTELNSMHPVKRRA